MMSGQQGKDEILARLVRSRSEIRRLLEPPPRRSDSDSDSGPAEDPVTDDRFPRSRTMRLLLSGRGIGTVGAVLGGLVMARPALAFRLLQMLPKGAVARMLLVKAVTALRSRR